jgi:very-short-patch-repair endonuclease
MTSHKKYREHLSDLERVLGPEGTRRRMAFRVVNARRHSLNARKIRSELELQKIIGASPLAGGYKRNECLMCIFIGDFVFPRRNLVLEADGNWHESAEACAKDLERDLILRKGGWHVYRFKQPFNHEAVLAQLREISLKHPRMKAFEAKVARRQQLP